jgi:hypothetical protein
MGEYNDYVETKKPPDMITKTATIMFVIYGILCIILTFSINFLPLGYLNSLFIVLGLLFQNFNGDMQKAILGIIGIFGSFYSAALWSQSMVSILTNIMIVYSVGLLAVSFAIVCHVTCTWPNLEYD